jgi:hypothetical protein
MSPAQYKLLKTTVKLAVGFGFTFLLGKTYEIGKQSEEKIDIWFEEKYPQTDDQNN